jgi:hypothetical protein
VTSLSSKARFEMLGVLSARYNVQINPTQERNPYFEVEKAPFSNLRVGFECVRPGIRTPRTLTQQRAHCYANSTTSPEEPVRGVSG